MYTFNLPDLGEGLPDAEIHEWFVKEGDQVKADQLLVSMETAKAVVEIPVPHDAIIIKLFGKQGDIIKTGAPLVELSDLFSNVKKNHGDLFSSNIEKTTSNSFNNGEKTNNLEKMDTHESQTDNHGQTEQSMRATASADQGTVVGNLEQRSDLGEDHFVVGSPQGGSQRVKATATVKMLAKKLAVDLTKIQGTGEYGFITTHDVEAYANKKNQSLGQESKSASSSQEGKFASSPQEGNFTQSPQAPSLENKSVQSSQEGKSATALEEQPVLQPGFIPLRGARRVMMESMRQSHRDVVSVSIFDEADIALWDFKSDITVRLILAICDACKKEPALNAWFDQDNIACKYVTEVNLGLAIDSNDGLFVPVIHNANHYTTDQLRKKIDQYKQAVENRSLTPDMFKGASFTLSNFGKFAGKFASPIIIPPTVAILAAGRVYEGVVVNPNRDNSNFFEKHRLLPLSLSFDHRAVTGGEATRFLSAVIKHLENCK